MTPPPIDFCSHRARAADVPLAGTATEASIWLLIEHPRPWGNKALPESRLPADLKSQLIAWEDGAEDRRIQFIRRETNRFDDPGGIAVFLCRVGMQAPQCIRFSVDGYEALAEVDFESAALALEAAHHENGGRSLAETGHPADSADSAAPAAADSANSAASNLAATLGTTAHNIRSVDDPLFLTCTNGRRDACCAKWGRAMAHAMTDAAGSAAWQTTHIGGHRFAPTQLVLPHGLQYGWLEPEDAPRLVSAQRDGRIFRLDRYRGHVGYSRPVQAAAVFLRRQLSERNIGALKIAASHRQNDDAWHVRLSLTGGAEAYDIVVRRKKGAYMSVSCSAQPKQTYWFECRMSMT